MNGNKRDRRGTAIGTMLSAALAVVVSGRAILAAEAPARIDLAPMQVGHTLRQAMTVTNSGAEAITITNVLSSCECLRIERFPEHIDAGGHGDIEVALTPAVTGDLAYELTAQLEKGDLRWSVWVSVSKAELIRARDRYITCAELRKRWEQREMYTLVDVRPVEAYEAAHLPGSINVPLSAVKTKTFLKGGPVILVDGGWGDPVLEDECGRLREAGFADVQILQGGLNAWRAAGGTFEGRAMDVSEVNRITGQEWLAVRGYDDWMVVAADTNELPHLQEQIPGCVRIPYSEGGRSNFIKQVQDRLGERTTVGRVLVLTRDGQGYASIEEALRGQVAGTVFYLQHGYRGLGWATDVQAASLNGPTRHTTAERTASKGTGKPQPCGTCPGAHRR